MEGARHIESLVRAIRSTGPRELLLKLAVHREELQRQLHAVMLQAVVRGFLGRQRVRRLTRRLNMFNRSTEVVASLLLEEFVLQTALDLAINFHRVNARYHRLRRNLEDGIAAEMESIVREVVQEEAQRATEALLLAAADALMAIRRRQQLQRQLDAIPAYIDHMGESRNPIIACLVALLAEECRAVVVDAVREETQRHLHRAHAERLAPQLLDEVVCIETLRVLLDEFAAVDEERLLAAALGLIEQREVAQLVLRDRALRGLQRQRLQLQARAHPRESSPEKQLIDEASLAKGERRTVTAAALVADNVARAMLQTLLRSHDALFADDGSAAVAVHMPRLALSAAPAVAVPSSGEVSRRATAAGPSARSSPRLSAAPSASPETALARLRRLNGPPESPRDSQIAALLAAAQGLQLYDDDGGGG